MPSQKHIIIVGDSQLLSEFRPLFVYYGIGVTEVLKMNLTLETVKKEQPDAVVFLLPRYWDDVTRFVQELRQDKAFETTPILYIGSLIEGEDQRILHQMGVQTLTLGPLPPQEVVRYIADMLK